MTRLAERLRWPIWITLLVGAGVALRVRQYLADRSLWADESFLALELIDKAPVGLLQPLGFNQGAPFGFLLAEKAVAELIGYSELALRLLPLLSGILALLVFVPLARRTISGDALPLALALVVVADGLIYYASEMKQYSGDVFVAVYLLAVAVPLARAAPVSRRMLLLGLGAVPLMWLSHPALFVAAAAGVVIAGAALIARPRDWALRIGVVAGWAISGLLLVLTAPDYDELRAAQAEQGDAFVSQSEGLDDPSWVSSSGGSISAGLGLPIADTLALVSKIVGVVALVGLVSLLRRDRVAAAILASTLALTIAVSALGLYPLYTRTLLFLVPVTALLIGQGVVELGSMLGRRRGAIVVAALTVLIAALPVVKAVGRLIDPPARQELKPALEYVRDHWRPGDVLYLSWGDQHVYLYYLRCDCFDLERASGVRLPSDVVLLEGIRSENYAAFRSSTPSLVVAPYHLFDNDSRLADLDRLRGRGRVWVVSAHVYQGQGPEYREEAIPRRLDRLGRRLDTFAGRGSRAYLYDLRP